MTEALDLRALEYACQRVEDFTRVHHGRMSVRDRTEATLLWVEYLGLNEEVRDHFNEWANRYAPQEMGGMMMGLVIGLLISQYQREHPRSQ